MRKFTFICLMIMLFVFSACSNGHGNFDSSQKGTGVSSLDEPSGSEEVIVNVFSVNDYVDEINAFSSDRITMPIASAQHACEIAEEIWLEIYGNTVLEEKPYVVYFDNETDIWLVHGTLPDNMLGGVAYIIIQKEDGKVLAVWHEK